MAFVVLTSPVGHPCELLPPLVQIVRIFWVERRRTFGVHIFQVALASHPSINTHHPEKVLLTVATPNLTSIVTLVTLPPTPYSYETLYTLECRFRSDARLHVM